MCVAHETLPDVDNLYIVDNKREKFVQSTLQMICKFENYEFMLHYYMVSNSDYIMFVYKVWAFIASFVCVVFNVSFQLKLCMPMFLSMVL